MIVPIIRTAAVSLRRDRAALALSFVLPVAFFTIFAVIFGGMHDTTPKITIILVDEDQSTASRQLVHGLQHENSLTVLMRPASKDKAELPVYTAVTAEQAVQAGDAPVALIIPKGFGQNPVSFGPGQQGPQLQMLNDQSDMIAPQVVAGLLQKAAMTSMPVSMAEQGMKYTDRSLGGFTPAQQQKMQSNLDRLRQLEASGQIGAGQSSQSSENSFSGILPVHARSVVGQNKKNPTISFYAAGVGVMFLLFTASGSAGVLLEEAESGTLDRVLSSRITMTSLLVGKLTYNTLLAFAQLTVMFVWAWLMFHLDLPAHIPGFIVMGLCTALSVAAFGMLLASLCRTRAQLGAVSTLLILGMSSIGGSMFPRYYMPAAMQKAGLLTINAWAIDGFTKVFWRDQPVTALWPQVSVLLGVGVVLFVLARRIARKWEFA